MDAARTLLLPPPERRGRGWGSDVLAAPEATAGAAAQGAGADAAEGLGGGQRAASADSVPIAAAAAGERQPRA